MAERDAHHQTECTQRRSGNTGWPAFEVPQKGGALLVAVKTVPLNDDCVVGVQPWQSPGLRQRMQHIVLVGRQVYDKPAATLRADERSFEGRREAGGFL